MSTPTLWKLFYISTSGVILASLVFLGLGLYVLITGDYSYNQLWFTIPGISIIVFGAATIFIIQTINFRLTNELLDRFIETVKTYSKIIKKEA